MGLGRRVLAALLHHAKGLGCASAWVLTDPHNVAGNGLYLALGGVRSPRPQLMYEFALARSR